MKAVLALALAVVALLSACAPQLQLPGPPVTDARLSDDRVITRDGLELPMRHWLPAGPPRAVVVALHGFNDYSQSYAGIGPYLAAHGLAVYAYDQRGFGRAPHFGTWAGTEALADDLTVATRLVAERHPGLPLYLLGESMGGAVIMVAMTRPQAPAVRGIVLSAPAVWGRATMNVFEVAGLWLFAHTLPGLRLTGHGLRITPSDNVEMLRALSRDPLVIKETRVDAINGLVDLMDQALAAAPRLAVPTLVLSGEKDEIVPPAATTRMIRTLPDPGGRQRVALYPNGYHMLMRDLQAEVVLRDIAGWIADPSAPLPSGADARAAAVLEREGVPLAPQPAAGLAAAE